MAAPPAFLGHLPPPAVDPAVALPITQESRVANETCIKRLEELQLQPGRKIYPTPADPGSSGAPVNIQTNVFGIDIIGSHEIYHYSVNIKADLSPQKEVVFTKKGKEDFVVTDRNHKCCAIFFKAVEDHTDFFRSDENTLIYDGQSVLFSTIDIFAGLEGVARSRLIQVNGADLGIDELSNLPCIKLEVHSTKNPVLRFTKEDMARRASNANIEAVSRAYHQLMELALNQHCIREYSRCVVFEHGKIFFFKPQEEGYNKSDCVDVGDGKQMMPGIKKTVHFIEGPQGRGKCNPSVVIDGMKVAFHKEQLVLDKISQILNKAVFNGISDYERERCLPVIRGLDCYTNHTGRVRHLKIEGIHHEGPATSRFELKDGGSTTVLDYFQTRYETRLQYPKANLIVCKEKGVQNFYPMELVHISPNQRVTISQQSSAQSQMTTKESAVLPNVRQHLIWLGKKAANISTDNSCLQGLGVKVHDEPLMVTARQLPAVKIAAAPMKENKWRFNNYARPATAPQIWALYCVGTQSTRYTSEQLVKFGEEFVNVFKSKGVNMPPPAEFGLIAATKIEETLDNAAKNNCKFVFVITDDSITSLHQRYKLIESSTNMVIQDMKLSKAISVISQSKRLTLENVINKTNVKLGGTNYVYTDARNLLDGHLIIGIGTSNPPPGTKFLLENKGVLNPMIVGFAYNGQHSQEFSGDFVLNRSGEDTLSSVEEIIREAIKGYQKWHKNQSLRRIIVYRSGASEGNHGHIMAFEIPLARAAMQEMSPGTQLVYISVTKDHTYRFFRHNLNAIAAGKGGNQTSNSRPAPPKPCDLNVGPGFSIDTEVTNPSCKQFFLNSHITLQGSAKTPLYTVLADDANTKMNGLEEVTYSLCHLHQIVGLPTSLPTPLYVANEYAKRGRNLWDEAIKKDPMLSEKGTTGDRLKDITQSLNYRAAGAFVDRRVNA